MMMMSQDSAQYQTQSQELQYRTQLQLEQEQQEQLQEQLQEQQLQEQQLQERQLQEQQLQEQQLHQQQLHQQEQEQQLQLQLQYQNHHHQQQQQQQTTLIVGSDWSKQITKCLLSIEEDVKFIKNQTTDLQSRTDSMKQQIHSLLTNVQKEHELNMKSSSSTIQTSLQTTGHQGPLIVMELIGLPPICYKSIPLDPVTIKLFCPDGSLPWLNSTSNERWTAGLRIRNTQNNLLSPQQLMTVFGQEIKVDLIVQPEWLEGTITGLNFKNVSSNFGGYLKLEPFLISPVCWTSCVSCSLCDVRVRIKPRQETKDIGECDPEDNLTILKGFGPTYAQKLSEMGYHTVGDLLSFPLPSPTDPRKTFEFKLLMEKLRKPRGKSEASFECVIRSLQQRLKQNNSEESEMQYTT